MGKRVPIVGSPQRGNGPGNRRTLVFPPAAQEESPEEL